MRTLLKYLNPKRTLRLLLGSILTGRDQRFWEAITRKHLDVEKGLCIELVSMSKHHATVNVHIVDMDDGAPPPYGQALETFEGLRLNNPLDGPKGTVVINLDASCRHEKHIEEPK